MSTSNPEENPAVEQDLATAGQDIAQAEVAVEQAQAAEEASGSLIDPTRQASPEQIAAATPGGAASPAVKARQEEGGADADAIITHSSDTEGPKVQEIDREAEAERPGAVDQAPIATARDKVIVGDSGLFEQQPVGLSANPDEPHRTSAPPASRQSGIPLPEDRAAGVTPVEGA